MQDRIAASMALPAVAVVLVLMASALPGAQASEWKPFGLQGTVVTSLAATPNRLCAGTLGSGVFCRRLTPGSDEWSSLGPAGAIITRIWIDPRRHRVMFAAAGGIGPSPETTLLYRTFDGGETWEPVDADLRRQGACCIHTVEGGYPSRGPSAHPPLIFAAGDGVWRSNDYGQTWESVFPGVVGRSLEVTPARFGTVWAGGETFIFSGLTILSRDLGANWNFVWDSSYYGDNQTSDIAAHPHQDGLVLTGHEGFVLRTEDDGESFLEVLSAPARFFLDWDSGNPDRAWAAGSTNNPGALAFVSLDRGLHWSNITGTVLAPRSIVGLKADAVRIGVVYVATDDGVYRFYGGGFPGVVPQ